MNAHDWARGKTGRSPPVRRKRGSGGIEADASAGLIQRKESCACGGTCPSCQAKSNGLAVSRAGDASEIEADRVAERVVRGESVAGTVGSAAPGADVARAAEGSATTAVSSTTSAGIRSSRGSGQALDAATQATMGQRFGQDLSGVRVHADRRAAELSEQLNARAFTVDNDIYFGRGRFDPTSADGTRLLAHELTHVVQQGAGSSELLQRDIDDEAMEQSSDTAPAMAEEPAAGAEPAIGGTEGDDADPMKAGCNAESNKHFLLANFIDFEFTVPKGCTATVTFSALWVPVDSNECCTGADKYSVKVNGKAKAKLKAGPNICEADHVPANGTITTGGGRQQVRIDVDRMNCTGIKMQLDVNIKIR